MAIIKVRVQTTIEQENGEEVVNNFDVFVEENESQQNLIEYVSENEGGPVMRPTNPPR